MPGVRIQHPVERNVMFTLVDSRRPYRDHYDCAVCGRVHVFKTYHFRLDETGAAVVSVEIVDRLKSMAGHGFRISGEVKAPPPQTLTFNGVDPLIERIPVVVHPSLTEAI